MDQLQQQLPEMMSWLLPLIIVLSIWEMIWKIIAMWRSARNKDLVWFIFIGVLNTAGILPIIYILTHKKKPVEKTDKIHNL